MPLCQEDAGHCSMCYQATWPKFLVPHQVGTQFTRGVSGGERKRTNIGMELITDPTILFLDEPTTGLDASTANAVLLLLKRWCRRNQCLHLVCAWIVFRISRQGNHTYHCFPPSQNWKGRKKRQSGLPVPSNVPNVLGCCLSLTAMFLGASVYFHICLGQNSDKCTCHTVWL